MGQKLPTSPFGVHPAPDTGAPTWGKPDERVLMRPSAAPTFPLDMLGKRLADWITEAGISTSAPVDYIASVLLAVCGTLIGGARRISPWAGWTEPSILWFGLVGEPSIGKTPAMNATFEPLRPIQRALDQEHIKDLQRWAEEAEVATAREEIWQKEMRKDIAADRDPPDRPASSYAPPKPKRRRITTNDATVEALAGILAYHPRGILVVRDELAGFLGGFDRYNKSQSDRPFFLEAYNGGEFTVDRVRNDDAITVPNLSISIVGGIQPERLQELILKGTDDGLGARFIWIYPGQAPVSRPSKLLDGSLITDIFERLFSLAPEPGNDESASDPMVLRLSGDAADLFHAWRKDHASQEAPRRMFGSWWGKAPGMVLRLALVLEHMWWARTADTPIPDHISGAAVSAAVFLMESYLKPMAERVYGIKGIDQPMQNAATLARYLLKAQPAQVNVRDLQRNSQVGLKNADLQRAVDDLVEAGWLRPTASSSPGRPRKDYDVNPRLEEIAS